MKRFAQLVVLALVLPPVASPAQDTTAARADGKAFAREVAPQAQAAATTAPDATRILNYTAALPQSEYFDDPERIVADSQAAASVNDGYRTMRSSLDGRARFDPQFIKDATSRATTIAADPNRYTGGMSASGAEGRCVPLPQPTGSPGRYQATCNTGYRVDTTTQSCTIPLAVSTEERSTYQYYAEVPFHTGFSPSIEQFSAALADGTCVDLGAADTCQWVREYGAQPSRRCADYRVDILQCSAEVPGLSGTPYPGTGQIWFSRDVVRTATTARDESRCATLAGDTECSAAAAGPAETCTDSDPVTRTIDGVEVTAPCWAWHRDYTCNRLTPAQDCSELEANAACSFVREDCLTDEAPCRSFERVYDCALPREPTAMQQFICDGDVSCINGECETIEREANTEFKDAAVALNAMAQARREWDPDTLSLFKGERETCHSKVFGVLNCCKGKGFPLLPGVSFLVALGCDREEVLLHQRDAQGLCAYVGSYCSDSVLGVCVTRKKVYCCFQSKLSRILQEQGRAQLPKPWARPKTEQCLGFTIQEFARLDLSQMDFSEIYAEFTEAARLPDELQTATELQQKIEDYYAATKQ
jgi:conjugal transfer mating pair stabilization protein TraN